MKRAEKVKIKESRKNRIPAPGSLRSVVEMAGGTRNQIYSRRSPETSSNHGPRRTEALSSKR
jgi:hypothetical protein